ncbi:hypothetical protein Caci_7446 [Catenulispora acidiphila DSM 44928]|uniref:Uncharacterized protein n=1 Tax=Catenulispora acidiphila (strain DSM 44928 / JCM 14897 / NBRC 102108 / NRRL B-24433 / ID139908) TaxID=479433 RepID=C7Q9V2_CATAD|nr:hypothetical protein [Catenulispora acidiphila]ACU76271.1 hypothetical protein Caci_7446 [Catenulispora acidiphila DSM 44928]
MSELSELFHRRRPVWLGLTAEPERELPEAVASLRMRQALPDAEPADPALAVHAERRRIGELVVRGHQRSWLRYLDEVTELVRAAAADAPVHADRALLAAQVVLDHHLMLIGLPGPAYRRVEAQRAALAEAVRVLQQLPNERDRT